MEFFHEAFRSKDQLKMRPYDHPQHRLAHKAIALKHMKSEHLILGNEIQNLKQRHILTNNRLRN